MQNAVIEKEERSFLQTRARNGPQLFRQKLRYKEFLHVSSQLLAARTKLSRSVFGQYIDQWNEDVKTMTGKVSLNWHVRPVYMPKKMLYREKDRQIELIIDVQSLYVCVCVCKCVCVCELVCIIDTCICKHRCLPVARVWLTYHPWSSLPGRLTTNDLFIISISSVSSIFFAISKILGCNNLSKITSIL